MNKPTIHPTAFVAPNATLTGDVTVEAEASIWFGCVLRAEEAPILIGPRTNVQDLTVVHTDPGYPCRLGADVTVGHQVVLHGATVEDGALIGIGAVVLNGAVVGKEAIVGAGAVVPEGTIIPPRTLAIGVPARVVRRLEEADLARLRGATDWYLKQARTYQGREEGDERGD
ncbi:MAG TPA: gamma carbonic anhydrase family protein [Anaerolineales bacterium]|nr:gamma carbonic anhydrase family protein [Anaerolineae bacterium]HIQ01164.1 gamma carbonic anhydrase family protein [Anaerolineales bacterium]